MDTDIAKTEDQSEPSGDEDGQPFAVLDPGPAGDLRLAAMLERCGMKNAYNSARVFPGVVGIRGDILDRACRTAVAFRSAAAAMDERAKCDPALRDRLLRPFDGHRFLRQKIAGSPFALDFFRMDFYIHPETGTPHILEVNTSPGTLPEFIALGQHCGETHDCSPPAGMRACETAAVARRFAEHLRRVGRADARTIGLIARNGPDDYESIFEVGEYAKAFSQHTGLEPILCSDDDGRIGLFDDGPRSIVDSSHLDGLFCNPAGSLSDRQLFVAHADKHGWSLLPPLSNWQFTNKAFLSVLRESLDDLGLDSDSIAVLKEAIIPSFPLSELTAHEEEIRSWKGLVLKKDVSSSGKSVEVLPYASTDPDQALAMARHLANADESWTAQAYVPHAAAPFRGKEVRFDLVIFLVMDPQPTVLPGSRVFTGAKSNIGQGASYAQVCRLPSA